METHSHVDVSTITAFFLPSSLIINNLLRERECGGLRTILYLTYLYSQRLTDIYKNKELNIFQANSAFSRVPKSIILRKDFFA